MRIRTFHIDLGKNVFHLAPEIASAAGHGFLRARDADFSGGLGHEFCVARLGLGFFGRCGHGFCVYRLPESRVRLLGGRGRLRNGFCLFVVIQPEQIYDTLRGIKQDNPATQYNPHPLLRKSGQTSRAETGQRLHALLQSRRQSTVPL